MVNAREGEVRFRILRLAGGGIILGACLAATILLWQPTSRAERGSTISPAVFRNSVEQKPGGLRDLRVFPPFKTAEGAQMQFVTGKIGRHVDLSETYSSFTFLAEIPFEYKGQLSPTPTVMDFLRGTGRTSSVSFVYAWWATKPFVITASFVGSLLLTLGALPSLVALIQAILHGLKDSAISSKRTRQLAFASGGGGTRQGFKSIPEDTLASDKHAAPLGAEGIQGQASSAKPTTYAQREYYPVAKTGDDSDRKREE